MKIKHLASSVAAVTVFSLSALEAVAQTGCPSGGICPSPPILCEIDGGPCSSESPYDLSRFNIPFPVIWPQAPVTDHTTNVSTISEFQAAVRDSNVRIIVQAGTYSGNLDVRGNDIDIVMSNSATLQGSVTMDLNTGGVLNRIRWTGGNIDTGGNRTHMDWFVHDLLVNDVYIEGIIRLVNASRTGLASARNAFVNMTLDGRPSGESFTLLMQRANAGGDFHEDLILANVLMLNNNNTPIRSQKLNRNITVESAFIQDSPSGTGYRMGENSNDAFVGGTTGKRTIVVGRFYMYQELLPANYAIRNAVFDGVDRYWRSNAAFNNGGLDNTGTVSNMDCYFSIRVGDPCGGIAPFSIGSGVSNVQYWDGVTMPDYSAYGAQR